MDKRPPIIAVMGHVDHGKTTLLDHIRESSVAEREAGGITQSIGAYEINKNGRKITFIDTPGHEAFAAMRAKSAKCADIAILVIAADDGVKPQTLNALEYIKKENIPFIVAINKIDKPNANVEKTKTDLASAGVYLEGFGGDVSWQEISAKNGDGIAELLDLVLLASDMLELTYDASADAEGIVLTSRLDRKEGNVVGVVIQNGSLKNGEVIATPSAHGKIKRIVDSSGKQEKSLVPSAPAIILGFETLPAVGEIFKTGKSAEDFCSGKISEMHASDTTGEKIALILKADESGSLEAMKSVLGKMCLKYPIYISSSGIGDIYENDIKLAEQMRGIMLGFKVRVDKAAMNMARAQNLEIITSDIIYELEKSIDEFFEKRIPKEYRIIKIRATFGESKGKERIIGGKVEKGIIRNHETFELWRNAKSIGNGKIINLQSGRKDVAEAVEGVEVGLLVESEMPIREDDELRFPEAR